MASVHGGDFKVSINRKDVVAVMLPLQDHWLPLSNLDLLLPPKDVGVFFCYSKPTSTDLNFGSMVGRLKKAIAQSLVSYFVFAGEVVPNPAGEPELVCNNRGVDFVEAFADVDLQDLNLYNPDNAVEGRLLPKKQNGVLAVQATELKCGGLVVGCTFDHRVADAYSVNMFLVSWAEMAQSKPISVSPTFRRSLLNPRRPALINPSLNDMYIPLSHLPPPKEPSLHSDHLISRIYHISADHIHRLQLLASSNIDVQRSKLESFSAFIWKMVAKYASKGGADKICKLGVVVDGRTRLCDGIDKEKAALMASYFGNVLSIPFGGLKVSELIEKSLSQVADQVHELLKNAVTKKHFLDLIDWVEAHRPEPGVAKIYCSGSRDGPAFVVSSGQRFPVSEVDFGWGKPAFGSYHFPWGGDTGYVMPMPSPNPDGTGDWVVYMHLPRGQLEFIESEASHVFRPFTFDCLQN